MNKIYFWLYCFLFSLVMGVCWGGLVATVHGPTGVVVGLVLFGLTFRVLSNGPVDPDEDEVWDRRFND